MSETGIVPFRVPGAPPIQPIDLALIPNENLAEQTRIEAQVLEIWNEFGRLRGARAKRTARRMGKWFVAPLTLILGALVFVGFVLVSTASLIAVLSLVAMGIATALAHEKELPPTAVVKELRQRKESLELRQSKLKSLDLLTGNNERAKGLLHEARNFNRHLANLDGEACTRKDALLIEEKRSELLTRISEFRGMVLELPGDPVPLLAAGNDDRA